MTLPKSVALFALALLTIGAKASPPDTERIVDASTGHMVTTAINGRPMKLRVDLDTSDWIMLNAASAARAGLDGSMLKFTTRLYGVKVKIDSSLTRVKVGALNKGRRVFWFDRDVIDAPADGIVGPSHLPENRVTLRFHPPVPGERTIELAVDHSMIRGPRYRLDIGEETIWVNLAPLRPLSVATAAAGAYLAQQRDGHWTGPPQTVKVPPGIDRPGRPMALRKPLDINGLADESFLVRTADYRGGFALPPDEEESADPDEIVITGKTSRGRAQLWLTLGKDVLGGCSSITHDKRRQMLILRCL